MWHMVGSEYSLKISGPQLLRFGIDSVLKIPNERITQWINEAIMNVFIEQPRLQLVCLKY